ncbi:putative glucose receptor git3 [Diaporthe ampelina]|uniref:Putative glucose receptor git3 n=1 Tax=Diaporthe ampelina TaxID=1214573 RepID=A0A0G2FAW6_9PEZI|nr:putative glucose receptor git3 [Diaporthe ampelina]
MAYDDVVARFTLAGSLISCIATFCVLVSYMVFRDELRSFRQALVFNLALAEFLNTLNNSISGCIYVQTKRLSPGPACIANGFINQLTVQAVDFTILAIVIVTLLTITQKTYLPSVSFRAKTIICLSTWAVPIITSTTALAMGAMSPVSGNWCWITAERTDLRYALTHGWRIAIILLTVLLYAYIWCDAATRGWSPLQKPAQTRSTKQHIFYPAVPVMTLEPERDGARESHEGINAPLGHRGRGFEREVRRMLLLNAYPTMYVLLWIPGIVNRFMEATGTSPSSTRIVGALQSTSQFVGFANALTFGLSATMRRRIASAAPSSKWAGRRREEEREG